MKRNRLKDDIGFVSLLALAKETTEELSDIIDIYQFISTDDPPDNTIIINATNSKLIIKQGIQPNQVFLIIVALLGLLFLVLRYKRKKPMNRQLEKRRPIKDVKPNIDKQ